MGNRWRTRSNIERESYVEFIMGWFRKGSFPVSRRDIERILELGGDVPYNIQRLCHVLWDLSDKILECAVSSDCTHIVTFNKRHFPMTVTAPWDIKVMTAGEFLLHWRDKP